MTSIRQAGINGIILRSDTSPVVGAVVEIRLKSGPTPGFSVYGYSVHPVATVATDETGRWEASVPSNGDLIPEGTYYEITERADGSSAKYFIQIPGSDDDYFVGDILLDDPSPVSAPGANSVNSKFFEETQLAKVIDNLGGSRRSYSPAIFPSWPAAVVDDDQYYRLFSPKYSSGDGISTFVAGSPSMSICRCAHNVEVTNLIHTFNIDHDGPTMDLALYEVVSQEILIGEGPYDEWIFQLLYTDTLAIGEVNGLDPSWVMQAGRTYAIAIKGGSFALTNLAWSQTSGGHMWSEDFFPVYNSIYTGIDEFPEEWPDSIVIDSNNNFFVKGLHPLFWLGDSSEALTIALNVFYD